MAATVQIHQFTANAGTPPGSSGAVDKTSGTIRFQRVDTTDNTSLANAIPVPTSGQSYSWRIVLRMYIQSAGGMNQISNVRWYSNGAGDSTAFGAGRKLWYLVTTAYTSLTANGIPNESQNPPQLSGTPYVSWFTALVGAPAAGGTGPYDNTSIPKYIADHINLVFEVNSASGPGVTGNTPINLAWDEI